MGTRHRALLWLAQHTHSPDMPRRIPSLVILFYFIVFFVRRGIKPSGVWLLLPVAHLSSCILSIIFDELCASTLLHATHPGRKYYENIAPATGEKLARTIQGTDDDVDLAVGAAKTAFESWSKLPGHVRARHM